MDLVSDVPGYKETAKKNGSNFADNGENGKRKSDSLDLNIRATKRQRATRSRKGKSLAVVVSRDGTVLDLKRKVRTRRHRLLTSTETVGETGIR